jgi:hypothetical protein
VIPISPVDANTETSEFENNAMETQRAVNIHPDLSENG